MTTTDSDPLDPLEKIWERHAAEGFTDAASFWADRQALDPPIEVSRSLGRPDDAPDGGIRKLLTRARAELDQVKAARRAREPVERSASRTRAKGSRTPLEERVERLEQALVEATAAIRLIARRSRGQGKPPATGVKR